MFAVDLSEFPDIQLCYTVFLGGLVFFFFCLGKKLPTLSLDFLLITQSAQLSQGRKNKHHGPVMRFK